MYIFWYITSDILEYYFFKSLILTISFHTVIFFIVLNFLILYLYVCTKGPAKGPFIVFEVFHRLF